MSNTEDIKKHLSGSSITSSSRKRLAVVIGISFLIIVLPFTFGLYASNQFLKMRTIWGQYADREYRFNSSLDNIHRTLGYGGFIHNFKNLVLRKNIKRYGPSVERDYQDLNKVLQQLDGFVRHPEDRDAIKTIRATVNTYYYNYQIATRMIQNGASSSQIDSVVHVDDTPALQAISILESSVRKDLLSTRKQAEMLVNTALINLFISEVIILLSLIFGVTLFVKLNKQLLDSNAGLSLAQKRLNNLLDNCPDAMLTVDKGGVIVRANAMAQRFFGYAKSELIGMSVERLVPEQYRSTHSRHRENYSDRPMERSMGSGIPLRALTKEGSTPNVDISLSYITESGNVFTNVTLRDTTQREEDKKKLESAAFTDSLTGIANRRKFIEFAEHEIARSKRLGKPLWFLVVDIDDFKNVNDTMGHLVGDSVIKAVAGVLESTIRSVDMVCRSGGEEFSIVLVDTTEVGAARVAETILSNVRNLEIDQWTDTYGPITVSIGCAQYDPVQDLKMVLKIADEAMYESKNKGKNNFTIFTKLQGDDEY